MASTSSWALLLTLLRRFLASANSGVSRSAVLATLPTSATAAPAMKARRQLSPCVSAKVATPNAANRPKSLDTEISPTAGYLAGTGRASVRKSSAPVI